MVGADPGQVRNLEFFTQDFWLLNVFSISETDSAKQANLTKLLGVTYLIAKKNFKRLYFMVLWVGKEK